MLEIYVYKYDRGMEITALRMHFLEPSSPTKGGFYMNTFRLWYLVK